MKLSLAIACLSLMVPVAGHSSVGISDTIIVNTFDDIRSIAAESSPFSLDTRRQDGLRGSSNATTFTLDTREALPGDLIVEGPDVIVSGRGAVYTARIEGVDWGVDAVWEVEDPSGALIYHAERQGAFEHAFQIHAGDAVPSGIVIMISASYTTSTGRVQSARKAVVVSAGDTLGADLRVSTPKFLRYEGSHPIWEVEAEVAGDAAGANVIREWRVDHSSLYTGTSAITFEVGGAGMVKTLKLEARDPSGRIAIRTHEIDLSRPAPNDPGKRSPARPFPTEGVRVLDEFGRPYQFDENRAANGFVLIVHGLRGGFDFEQNFWMSDMADAIETRMSPLGRIPNIAILDWRERAWPTDWDVETKDVRNLGRVSAELANTGAWSEFLYDLLKIRWSAEAVGEELGDWLIQATESGQIRADRPVHLIGHSAGGFVVSEAGKILSTCVAGINTQVTLLDTPFLKYSSLTDLTRSSKVERVISSVGKVTFEDEDRANDWRTFHQTQSQYHETDIRSGIIGRLAGWIDLLAHHSEAHGWYTNTILGLQDNDTGFNTSVLFTENSPPPPVLDILKMGALPLHTAAEDSFSMSPMTNVFSSALSFGSSESNADMIKLKEDTGNAGIYENVQIPVHAVRMHFRYRFINPGDGEFLTVMFGESTVLHMGLNLSHSRQDWQKAEVSLHGLGGKTGYLTLKLVSHGTATHGEVWIENPLFEFAEDPDGDGLTTADEEAFGTNPLAYDTDADGLSDFEEIYGVPASNPLLADTDFDGLSDFAEKKAGTNPLDPASHFPTPRIVVQTRGVLMQWNGMPGRTYQIQQSENPSFATYRTLASGLVPQMPVASFFDPAINTLGGARLFFRVVIE